MVRLLEFYRTGRRYYRDYQASKGHQIKLFNYQWSSPAVSDHWLYQFIIKRGILTKSSKKSISIFSVNGDKSAIDFNRSNIKIFYTAENVHVPFSHWQKYEDLLLTKKSVNLSLGFDYINHPKYLRFPYWIMANFKPDDDYTSIKNTCNQLTRHEIDLSSRLRFCSFICKFDYFGNRKIFHDQFSAVDHIHCDGLFLHNNDDLKNIYNDNKREYLKNYKFNLCPENTDSNGYVTEKIFDAIHSGCIPIYWGSQNNPEPDILNHSAILFFNENDDNSGVIKELKLLNTNPELYRKFAMQDRLIKNADEVIYEVFINLEKKIRELVNV